MKKLTKAGSVKKISGTDFWEVRESFVWYIIYGADERVVVKKGFRTNFGSIPRLFWWILSPTDWNAYVLHDYLYSIQYRNDRNECDIILYEALVAEGCNKAWAFVIYAALFCFGGRAWKTYHKKP